MNSGNRRSFGLVVMGISLLFVCSTASATTVTIALDDSAATSGQWSAGDLIRVVITAESDGGSGHGLSIIDFKTNDFAITVNDPTKLKIHDVLMQHPTQGDTQIDTESDAYLWDGSNNYSKDDDTWVYDELADFLGGSVDVSETSFEAVANAPTDLGSSLGTEGPIEFLHLVLEVQPGFALNDVSGVELNCEVAAYNTDMEDTYSEIFGSSGGSENSGQLLITNIPEPTTVVLLSAGLAGLLRRRRRV